MWTTDYECLEIVVRNCGSAVYVLVRPEEDWSSSSSFRPGICRHIFKLQFVHNHLSTEHTYVDSTRYALPFQSPLYGRAPGRIEAGSLRGSSIVCDLLSRAMSSKDYSPPRRRRRLHAADGAALRRRPSWRRDDGHAGANPPAGEACSGWRVSRRTHGSRHQTCLQDSTRCSN